MSYGIVRVRQSPENDEAPWIWGLLVELRVCVCVRASVCVCVYALVYRDLFVSVKQLDG